LIPAPIWTNAARRDLRAIDANVALSLLKALTRFLDTGQGDVIALQGALAGTYRLRVGDYRIRFEIVAERRIQVLRVLNRREAY